MHLHVIQEFPAVIISVGRILFKAFHDYFFQPFWKIADISAAGMGFFVTSLPCLEERRNGIVHLFHLEIVDLRGGVSFKFERNGPAEHLVHKDAEGVDVRPCGKDTAVFEFLRSHVFIDSRLPGAASYRVAVLYGKSEVQQDIFTVHPSHYVLRVDVVVYDLVLFHEPPLNFWCDHRIPVFIILYSVFIQVHAVPVDVVMAVCEGIGDLEGEPVVLFHGDEALVLCEEVVQVGSFYVFHLYERLVVYEARLEYADDVGYSSPLGGDDPLSSPMFLCPPFPILSSNLHSSRNCRYLGSFSSSMVA